MSVTVVERRVRTAVIVDDTPEVRLLLRQALERDGDIRVVGEAADGVTGVAPVRRTQPDVVLLDLSMPVMDGLEALPLIRRDAPHALVVMLSGYPSSKFEQTARWAGADGYLEKKDLVAELLPRLREILESRKLLDQPPAQRQAAAENGARTSG
jgi:DNA-binding NarL/FixJ family response regulator